MNHSLTTVSDFLHHVFHQLSSTSFTALIHCLVIPCSQVARFYGEAGGGRWAFPVQLYAGGERGNLDQSARGLIVVTGS